MKIGLVVPHIFMHEALLDKVIFSPGELARDLADGLTGLGEEVTLFTPGPIKTKATNITADLRLFEQELAGRGDTYIDLLKKHPFTFITLARQVQSEIIADAFTRANRGEFDLIHIYTNEEDTALPFAALCTKPVIFTHHDPFNFLVKYKNVFPKYAHLNWLSMSLAQRRGMPPETNWVGNIYHGLDPERLQPIAKPVGNYIAYLGRIIQPKGVHLAIDAVKKYNQAHPDDRLKLKIAGKHYAGHKKDTYWQEKVEPLIDSNEIEYIGFIKSDAEKQAFLGNARALMVPSLFDEPFGMVMIEALACGTPLIGLDSGAIPEVITPEVGILVEKKVDEAANFQALADAIPLAGNINRQTCRQTFEANYTLSRMCQAHLDAYRHFTQ